MAKNKPSSQPQPKGSEDADPNREPLAQDETQLVAPPAENRGEGTGPADQTPAPVEPSPEEVAAATRTALLGRLGRTQLAVLEQSGFDIALFIELAQLAPEIAALVKRVLDIIRRPRPAPVYRANHHPTADDLVESILCNALCAARAALQLKGLKE